MMMKRVKFKKMVLAILVISGIVFTSCKKDEYTASVEIKELNASDLGGDFTGNGGDATETYIWNNPQSTADYNCDITGTNGGSFQMTIDDKDGIRVLDVTLIGGQEPDSKSGVTSTGAPGDWTVTFILKDFNGDGSFSLTSGN